MPSMRSLENRWVVPGFRLSLGLGLFYLSLVMFIPFGVLLGSLWRMAPGEFLAKAVLDSRVRAAYSVSLSSAFIASAMVTIWGFIVAWTLSRCRFTGRRFIDAAVDIPFALPTAVSGIALTTLYSANGWLGRLFEAAGIKIAYARPGIVLALMLIGLPFVVRTLQPAILQLDADLEDASASLGAGPLQTFFRLTLPTLLPAILTAFSMAFARSLGEFGSVYFIAGNLPYRTEIAPLLIVMKLEQYDYNGAAAIGIVMLGAAFVLLLGINTLQWLARRHSIK